MAESSVVEFYIACNPPLLAQGVKDIIESAKSACRHNLVEILYEPDIPWFKCITVAEHQHKITDIIQKLIHKLLDLETESLGFNAIEDTDVIEGVLRPDVRQKVTKDPRVIPWLVYKSLGSDIYDTFTDYRFPEAMDDVPFKAVWRGLQSSSGVSVETLLSSFRRLLKSENAPITASDFAFLSNSEISYNLRENLLYIGSWHSMAIVDKTVRKLQAMLSLLASKPKLSSQYVLPEGLEAVRLTYRWMSHVGLARATFAVRSGNLAIADEYKLLTNAAVIRTEIQDRHGRWIPDNTVYPLKDAPQFEAGQTFNAFKGYVPPTKAKHAKIRVLHESECAKEQRGSSLADTGTCNNLHGPARNSQKVPCKSAADNLKLNSPVPTKMGQELARNQELDNDQDLLTCQQLSVSTQLHPAVNSVDVIVESIQRLTIDETGLLDNHGQPMAESCLLDWEEGIGSTTPFGFTMPNQSQEDLLISLTDSDEEAECGSEAVVSAVQSTFVELQQVNEEIIRLEEFKRSGDLIWLDNGSQAHQPPPRASILKAFNDGPAHTSLQSFKISQAENRLSIMLTENNPLEAQEQGSMGMHPDDLVHFGSMEERPRELFQTMNQRGGRGIANSTKRARSPGGAGSRPSQAPAARNQGIQASTTRARLDPRTPMGPRPDSDFDTKFPALTEAPKSPEKQTKKPLLYSDAAKFHNTPYATISRTVLQRSPRFDNLIVSNGQPRQAFSVEKAAPAAESGKSSSKEPKLEDLHERNVYEAPVKSDILKDTENQLKKMSEILEMCPGYVSLEVMFGRIYIKKMGPSLVNHTGSGPTFSAEEALELLNGAKRQDCIGFSPILSTLGSDANMLVSITPPDETPWHLFEKETWYDLECITFGPKGEESIIVELNADNFQLQYRIRGPRQELFAIHLHCPQRAWDLKACGVRSTAVGSEDRLKCFVEALVDQLAILVDDKGDVIIRYPNYEGAREIETISMRQVARYRHGKKRDSSVLTVTMTYPMEDSMSTDERGIRIFARSKVSLNSALPNQYFEASITSSRLRHHFRKNVNLEYGDKATWDTDQLESEGVFEDILRPAFGMISHMDHIGSSNDTMRGITDQDAFHEALVESDVKKKKKWAFW